MEAINVMVNSKKSGELFYNRGTKEYIFNYTKDSDIVSLTMPLSSASYMSSFYLHPIFEMNMPEGYLFELLKNHLSKKFGEVNDFLMLSFLAPNISGRVGYKSNFKSKEFDSFTKEEILNSDNKDTFLRLVSYFLDKNAISGVQPKSLALLYDKESLMLKEYIVKSWGDEYPYLAQNEYYSMMALKRAGIKSANIELSKHNKFLLVERFNYNKNCNSFNGFEELLVLMGKNRDKKYSGSYEQIAKVVYSVSTFKSEDMEQLFKLIVMNYLLKNGDAHLKNFAITYDSEIRDIRLSPAYDVVTTTAYIYKDKPALTMFGKKIWWAKEALINFGIKYCYLKPSKAKELYNDCFNALKLSIKELEKVIKEDSEFYDIGSKMLKSWRVSLDEKNYKVLPL